MRFITMKKILENYIAWMCSNNISKVSWISKNLYADLNWTPRNFVLNILDHDSVFFTDLLHFYTGLKTIKNECIPKQISYPINFFFYSYLQRYVLKIKVSLYCRLKFASRSIQNYNNWLLVCKISKRFSI